MQNEMTEKLQELAQKKEYVQYLFSLGSAEAISKELEKEGIELTPDEIRQIGVLARKKANGELTDEDLENVSGGILPLLIGTAIIIAAIAVGGSYYHVGKEIAKRC